MKKYYMMPQTEAMTFALGEHVMGDDLLIPSSGAGPTVGDPNSAPMRKASVMYI